MFADINSLYTINAEPAYLTDMKVIAQSLNRLFSTKIGSVPFNRGYGSHVWELLFENTDLFLNEVETLICQDITMWEPRVTLNPSDIQITKLDEHSYSLYVTFIVPSFNYTRGEYAQQIIE